MKSWSCVSIVGVGLLGASLGLALRRRGLAGRVLGIGRRAESLRAARELGAVDETTLDLHQGVAAAELVVVCTPVEQIVDRVREAAAHCPAGALITDVGSTKQRIVACLDGSLGRGVHFVGSHPLAGSEKRGPQAADANLFVNRTVVLTPGRATRPQDCRAIAQFWSSLGARVRTMSPAQHDRALAVTSHLPHALASALAAATPPRLADLTAGGWQDTTRVAAGDPELWTQILLENRANVAAALERFDAVLGTLREAIARGDRKQLKRLLAKGKRHRDAVGN